MAFITGESISSMDRSSIIIDHWS